MTGPPEDKYFKILQNLQAKGAVGARGKLLEGAGLAARERRENRMQALGDSAGLSDRFNCASHGGSNGGKWKNKLCDAW